MTQPSLQPGYLNGFQMRPPLGPDDLPPLDDTRADEIGLLAYPGRTDDAQGALLNQYTGEPGWVETATSAANTANTISRTSAGDKRVLIQKVGIYVYPNTAGAVVAGPVAVTISFGSRTVWSIPIPDGTSSGWFGEDFPQPLPADRGGIVTVTCPALGANMISVVNVQGLSRLLGDRATEE